MLHTMRIEWTILDNRLNIFGKVQSEKGRCAQELRNGMCVHVPHGLVHRCGCRARRMHRAQVHRNRQERIASGIVLDTHTETQNRCGTSVYLLHMPLIGFEQLDSLFPEHIGDLAALHVAVVIEASKIRDETHIDGVSNDECTGNKGGEGAWFFDFLPDNPTSPMTAVQLLTGQSVKGKTRTRHLKNVPTQRCSYIGESAMIFTEALRMAIMFQESWCNKELRLQSQDCYSHASALLALLEVDPKN